MWEPAFRPIPLRPFEIDHDDLGSVRPWPHERNHATASAANRTCPEEGFFVGFCLACIGFACNASKAIVRLLAVAVALAATHLSFSDLVRDEQTSIAARVFLPRPAPRLWNRSRS
jgi:hypothetical protein